MHYWPVTDEDIVILRHFCHKKISGFIKIKSGHKKTLGHSIYFGMDSIYIRYGSQTLVSNHFWTSMYFAAKQYSHVYREQPKGFSIENMPYMKISGYELK